MPSLTERQEKLLRIIVEDYIETTEPVGSETIVKKYDLGVSPATIRNEMVELAKQGFIKKAYSSSGRVPTSLGFRYYIKVLMPEKKVPVSSEVALRQRLYERRFQENNLIKDAVTALAHETKKMAMGTIEEGPFYYAGVANILDAPEFYDIDLTRTVLGLIDQDQLMRDILSKVISEETVSVLIGNESGMETLHPCSIVFSRYQLGKRQGYLGILGPSRMRYPTIMPTVGYISSLIEEFLGDW